MKLNHLKLVLIVGQEGSLTRAGEKLFISQPALSHQLKELEEYCGGPVFKRIGKKMVFTELGEKIKISAEKIFTEIETLEKSIKSHNDKNHFNIKISSGCYTNYYWLPFVIKSFYELYPDSEIDIKHEATDNPIKYLLEGEIDIAIVSSIPKDKNLVYEKVFDDQLIAVVNNDHPWTSKKSVEVKQFANQDLIIYPRPITAFQKLLKSEKVSPNKEIKVQLTEARIEMIKAGFGVSVLANWAVQPYLNREEVSAVKISRGGLHRSWYAVYLKSNEKQKHYTDLVSIIKKVMKDILGKKR